MLQKKLRLVALAAFFICVVVILLFTQELLSHQESPDFLIRDVRERVREHRWDKDFLVTFDVENNGTAAAHNVAGTVKYLRDGEWVGGISWHFNKAENVLEPSERCTGCYAVFYHCNFTTVPSKKLVITVLCDEGVLREIDVTIP